MKTFPYTDGYSNQKGYSKDHLNKIGNSVIFLAERINDLSKTKLLKLIYLLDELSIKKFSIPFFNLEYKVWQAGPVNVDIYFDLSSSKPTLLKDFIKIVYGEGGEYSIVPKKKFNDDEFSDNEVELLKKVVDTYGRFTASRLVKICHNPETIWYQIAEKNGLLEPFEKGRLTTSDFSIDFVEYLKNDQARYSLYTEHKDFLNFSKRFKKD